MATAGASEGIATVRGVSATILGEISRVLDRVDSTDVERALDLVHTAHRVFVCGEGRSGLMAKAFAMRLMHLGITTYVIGETTTPAVGAGDCLIAVSGSGETHATVRVSAMARDAGVSVICVTTNQQSTLAKASQLVVVLPAATKHRLPGEPDTIQPLSSLFDQACHVVFDVMCVVLADERKVSNAQARLTHANTE
jgi:6-phospho-3-hexuloisomerase